MAKKKPDFAQLNETGRRKQKDRRVSDVANVAEERRAPGVRRRHIDPTTCERDYSEDELEFMRAVDEYKRKNRRMFPTCSELLEVLRDLGYQKISSTAEEKLPAAGVSPAYLEPTAVDNETVLV